MVDRVHRAVVQRVVPLGAGMLRVVFGGDGLDGFVSTGIGDEYLRMWLPHDGETEPVLPVATGAGSWEFADGVVPSPLRTYTVRRWDAVARELTIDMVLHGHGLAARWAQSAAPGAVVGVNTPRGMYDPPAGFEWILMVTDSAGLPAAARILETLPSGVRARVFLEVPDAGHEQHLPAPPGTEVHWLHGGNGHRPSRIAEIVSTAVVNTADLPPGTGYIWVAGETHVTRVVRKRLRHELGMPSSAYKVVGYWTDNVEEWTARYEALPADVRAHLETMWDDPERDEEDTEDEYDEVLTRFQL